MWGFPDSSVDKESACNAGNPGLIPRLENSLGEGIGYPLLCSWASLVAQLVKNLPEMQETWVWSLGCEDPLEKEEKGYPLQYSGLENSMNGISHRVTKSLTWLSDCYFMGYLSWVFIGRTDAEAETPILWPPHAKSWLIGKDPDAGRDWRQEEKGMTENGMAGWHHRLDGHEFE